MREKHLTLSWDLLLTMLLYDKGFIKQKIM